MTIKFYDRRDAGKYLADKIKLYIKNNFSSEEKKESFIVMAIPRGGIIIGDVIASELNIDMDIIISKKIGAENNPELAIGAIMADGSYILNEDIVNRINISNEYIKTQVEIKKKEIERRLMEFRGKKDYHNELKDRVIILVDDGIATGATVLAALKWIKEKQHYKKLIVAVPVAPAESDILDKLNQIADKVIVIFTPYDFSAVGQFYEHFDQVSDKEVKEIMNKYNFVT
ncbi:MAG TPA: phosphoribosyltransferase family protein [Nitrososphaeraceae archaeon]|nr:phosphoribosyltransferase family protein [Nitrososphaeraceae archaeon]